MARAAKIGDTGASAPCHWRGGLGKGVAHAIFTIYAVDEVVLDDVTAALLDAGRGAIVEVSRFDGATFPGGFVHFGYRDGISQPRTEGLREDAEPDHQPVTPTGSLVLGYPSQYENLVFTVPQPEVLGRDGTYNAFRVLEQHVVEFDAFLADSVAKTGLARDLVAAKLLGRWPNGNPLILFPDHAGESLPDERINDYGYADDPDGVRCPLGSHMRRANPATARWCSGASGTAGGWYVAARRTDLRTCRERRTTASSEACSATSSAPACRHSSRP